MKYIRDITETDPGYFGCIYILECIDEEHPCFGKRYVGQTTQTLPNRMYGHWRAVRAGKDHPLYNAMRETEEWSCTLQYLIRNTEPLDEEVRYMHKGTDYTSSREKMLHMQLDAMEDIHIERSGDLNVSSKAKYQPMNDPEVRKRVADKVRQAHAEGRMKPAWTEERRKRQSKKMKEAWARLRQDEEFMREFRAKTRRNASRPRPGAKGTTRSAEHRAKMSAGLKASWIKRKQKEETQ